MQATRYLVRKVILFMVISLDGFVGGPKGELDWEVRDEEVSRYLVGDLLSTGDALLLGRVLYQVFWQAWPAMASNPSSPKELVEFAHWIEDSPKIVFSTALREAEWKNSRVVSVFVQEYIPGDVTANHGFAAYFDPQSMPHCIVTYRRLSEWPRDSPGIASMAISVCEPELVELTTKFFSGLKFHGVVQAEFKRDPRDHRWKIMDVNPRAWASNRLATASGCNIPYAAYADYEGIPLQESYMRPQVRWVNFVDTAFAFLSRWRQSGLSLSDLRIPRSEKMTYAVFDWNDTKPFIWFLRNVGWASRLRSAVRSPSGWGEGKTASARVMVDAHGEAKLHSRQ
jgi:dihydrofolate reductase